MWDSSRPSCDVHESHLSLAVKKDVWYLNKCPKSLGLSDIDYELEQSDGISCLRPCVMQEHMWPSTTKTCCLLLEYFLRCGPSNECYKINRKERNFQLRNCSKLMTWDEISLWLIWAAEGFSTENKRIWTCLFVCCLYLEIIRPYVRLVTDFAWSCHTIYNMISIAQIIWGCLYDVVFLQKKNNRQFFK